VEETNYWHRRLLRPRRERPGQRASEPRDEISPFDHSITSPALWAAYRVGGECLALKEKVSQSLF